MGSTFEASSSPVDSFDAHGVDLAEAARQLQQASHDARVAFDCIGLEDNTGKTTDIGLRISQLTLVDDRRVDSS